MTEAMMKTLRDSVALEGAPMNQIAKLNLAVPVVANPMELLASALERGMAPDMIDKLMGLQERWEATQARKAFDKAVAAAKAEIKPVLRNRKGHNGSYSDLANIAEHIDPILAKHGLSYRHRAKQDERIQVTCILSHDDGHFEETPLAAPEDKTGNKNNIQAIGSTLTYLQRYTVVLALGLSISSNDDDGKSAGAGDLVTEEQAETLKGLIVEVAADLPGFLKYFKIGHVEELSAKEYPRAIAALEKKRAKL